MRRWAPLALAWLAATAAWGQSWQVTARAEPAHVALGESLELCVTVSADVDSLPPSPRVDEPSWPPGLVPVGLQHESQTYGGGQFRYDVCWTLQSDRLGQHTIPAIEVAWAPAGRPLQRRSEPVTIDVTAAGQRSSESPPDRPMVLGPRPEPRLPRIVIATLAAAIVVCAAAAFWLLRGPSGGATVAATPEQSCLAALRRAAGSLRQGDPAGYYAAASEALRAYVEADEAACAGLTTSELLARLERRGAGRALLAAAGALLAAGDEVRFARGSVPAGRSWQLLRQVETALGETADGKGT